MSNNPRDNDPDVGKSERIYLYEAYEVEYWMRKLGVSELELKRAVKSMGNRTSDVEEYFENKKRSDS